MAYTDRLALYKRWEEKRARPLLVYVTTKRDGVVASMASDAVTYIISQLHKIPPHAKALDLMIASYGGDPMVAWRLVSLIRQRV